MINYKLRLFTPCSSYGAEEMTPKSQLCTCSFQDSLRQKNWALEQIRKFPDAIGYVWTAENDSNTLRVDAKIFASAKKYLRKKKFPDTCGHGLNVKSKAVSTKNEKGMVMYYTFSHLLFNKSRNKLRHVFM